MKWHISLHRQYSSNNLRASSDKFPIHHDAVCNLLRNPPFSSNWQPLHGMSFEEGPRRSNDDEGESGSTEADVEGQLDILEDKSNNKCNTLSRKSAKASQVCGNKRTPTTARSTVASSSESLWPSKS